MRRKTNETEREREYFGSVEPNQIERVEIEGRVRAVEDGPRSELSGREAWDYNAGELRVVELRAVAVASLSGSGDGDGDDGENGEEDVRA